MVNRKPITRLLPITILAIVMVGQLVTLPGASTKTPAATVQAGPGIPYPLHVTLHGTGASFPAPLISTWATAYNTANPNVTIAYASIGSGKGQLAAAQKVGDFFASDAPLGSQARTLYPNILHIPETIGSVVLAYNIPKDINGATFPTVHLNITGDLAARIFFGSVHVWNDAAIKSLNPGVANLLPNVNITTVHRSDGSGTTFVFTSWLASVSTTWATNCPVSTVFPTACQGTNPPGCLPLPCAITGAQNPGVAQAIQTHDNTIGYVELNYALCPPPGPTCNPMTFANIRNSDNTAWIDPSNLQATFYAVANFTSTHVLPAGSADWSGVSMLNQPGLQTYPIASFTYFLVYKELNILPSMNLNETTQKQALINFLNWVISTGQTYSGGDFYIPLPAVVVANDQASINSITYTILSKPVHRTFNIAASNTAGWSIPSITAYSGDTITLMLTSSDTLAHQWYLDFNNNGLLDPNEDNTNACAPPGSYTCRASPVFSSSTTPTNFTFIPLIFNSNSIPSYGSWTFRDSQLSTSSGTFQISPQQIAIPFVPPGNNPTIKEPNPFPHFDTSIIATQGSIIVDTRTDSFSGNITEIAVVGTSVSGTPVLYQLSGQLSPSTGDKILFLVNAPASPYTLSSNIQLIRTGLTGTITYSVTRTLDIQSQGTVNIVDAATAAYNFGTTSGQPNYCFRCDVLNRGSIDVVDMSQIALFFDAKAYI